MDLVITSEYHTNEFINIETIKTLGFLSTLFFMWILHKRQIEYIKKTVESNILKKLKKINKNQTELFTIVQNIDFIIHNIEKFKQDIDKEEEKPDKDQEDEDKEDQDDEDKEDQDDEDKEDQDDEDQEDEDQDDEDKEEDQEEEDDDSSSDYEP